MLEIRKTAVSFDERDLVNLETTKFLGHHTN